MSWNPTHLPDQHGRTAVVTGGSAGIGYHVAEQLAAAGAHVIVAARSPQRTEAAVASIRGQVPGASVEGIPLDLADLVSVQQAAAGLQRRGPVDILVNNAGVTSGAERTETADGFETMFGTNHLGHFALTLQLLPALLERPTGRVVTLGSLTHTRAALTLDDLQSFHSYRSMRVYGRSKLAALLFAFELDRRLRAAGSPAVSLAAHPGWAVGELDPARPPVWSPTTAQRLRGAALALMAQSKQRGAWPVVRAALDPLAAGGRYYGPGGVGKLKGAPVAQRAADHAYDHSVAARLWDISETLTGVCWPLKEEEPAKR
ncbi:oxidoreductase (plasmid) [Kitasatospora sp. NBC_00070]|uniref:oxidoreductase n=1 Tax=Kitasatospora sp. NBC_00070 TaxID=2975962 RepID=UPI002F907280